MDKVVLTGGSIKKGGKHARRGERLVKVVSGELTKRVLVVYGKGERRGFVGAMELPMRKWSGNLKSQTQNRQNKEHKQTQRYVMKYPKPSSLPTEKQEVKKDTKEERQENQWLNLAILERP